MSKDADDGLTPDHRWEVLSAEQREQLMRLRATAVFAELQRLAEERAGWAEVGGAPV